MSEGIHKKNVVSSLLIASIHLSELNTTQSESKKKYMSSVPCGSVVGSLMYVMVCTRLDLA